MNNNNHFANGNQTILFFKPRFGYIDIIGRNARWLHRYRGLLNSQVHFNAHDQCVIKLNINVGRGERHHHIPYTYLFSPFF